MQTERLLIELPTELYCQLKSIPNWEQKLKNTLPDLVAVWQQAQTLQRITELQQLELACERGLIQVFKTCFAESPYCQYHSDDDVRAYFEEYRLLGVLYLAWRSEKVVGFTASLPLIHASIFNAEMVIEGHIRKFDAQFLRSHLDADPGQVQYVADLGVQQDYRSQGIGSALLQTLLTHFPSDTPWLLRVLAMLKHTQGFYQKFGFKALPTIQTVKYLHLNQTYQENQRLILAKPKNKVQ